MGAFHYYRFLSCPSRLAISASRLSKGLGPACAGPVRGAGCATAGAGVDGIGRVCGIGAGRGCAASGITRVSGALGAGAFAGLRKAASRRWAMSAYCGSSFPCADDCGFGVGAGGGKGDDCGAAAAGCATGRGGNGGGGE
jgi:hypothetical protein